MRTDLANPRRPPPPLAATLIGLPGTAGERLAGVVRHLRWCGALCDIEAQAADHLGRGDGLTLALEPAGADGELILPARVERLLPEREEGDGRRELELEFVDLGETLRERLARRIRALTPAILLVGFGAAEQEAFRSLLGRSPDLLAAEIDEALGVLAEREVAVLALGGGLEGEQAVRFLGQAAARDPDASTANLVLAAGADAGIFIDLVSEDRVYYLTQQPVIDADLAAIVESALDRWWSRRLGERGPEAEEEGARRLQGIVEVARRVALQRSLDSAGELTETAVCELLAADRAYYLVYDADREVLWSGDPASRSHREESAAAGLVSFVARTGRALLLDRLGGDPRYEREADDPRGSGEERFLAVPVRGSNRSVLAVLVAVREPERPPFGDSDLVGLEILADQVASSFSQLVLQERLDTMSRRQEKLLRGEGVDLFRQEAMKHYSAGDGEHGDVLRLSPRWTRWTYWLLFVLVLSGLAFSVIGTLVEWASGPAVVRMQGSHDLTATAAGVVTEVAVAAGDPVAPGQLLVRFYGAEELAELQRIEEELSLQLVNRLRNPSDRGAAAALITLRAQRQLAEARLEERSVRAPIAGEVADVRVRDGQHVAPGEIVATLVSEGTEPTILALLPGHYRPLLEPGMRLRFEVSGYEYAYLDLRVDSVGEEVIGPAEARRTLSTAVADAVPIPGPVVLVEARLPEGTFEARGVTYSFHDGMHGTAEVAVRSDHILLSLFPRLKVLFERGSAVERRDG